MRPASAVAAPITRSASTAIGPRLTLSRRDKREVVKGYEY
jgi:hypothetical protein